MTKASSFSSFIPRIRAPTGNLQSTMIFIFCLNWSLLDFLDPLMHIIGTQCIAREIFELENTYAKFFFGK